MRIHKSGSGISDILTEGVHDNIKKLFQLALAATGIMFGYLMWGLFTGALSNFADKPNEARHALDVVNQVSNYLNVTLVVTLLTAILLYYEEAVFGFSLLAISAFLAYGFQFAIDLLFDSDAHKLTAGDASKALMHELFLMAIMIGAPGILMVLRSMGARFLEMREGDDLTNIQYGSAATKEKVPRAVLPVLSKCWQLPYCRSGVRKNCPIFLAKTKCWKERTGCMCDENILMLAMGGTEAQAPVNMTKEIGFVPIGDLLATDTKRANIATRVGPHGVRIPVNPNISDAQKRDRCRNCVIYNEHQRNKFSFFSVPVTLAVPVIVAFQFDNLRMLLTEALRTIDKIVAHLNLSGDAVSSGLTKEISGSMPIETILIVCLTLVLMTWAQRLLEYCVFKIKI